MDNVIEFGRGRKPPPPPAPSREPRHNFTGVGMRDQIVTVHLEEEFVKDAWGDFWAPITYITIPRLGLLCLMNCADTPPPADNDQGDR